MKPEDIEEGTIWVSCNENKMSITDLFYFFLKSSPQKKFINVLPTFFSTPLTEVSIPVSFANFCFAAVIPRAFGYCRKKPL